MSTKYYVIKYNLADMGESFFVYLSYSEIFAYSSIRGYLINNESIDLVVNELALSIMQEWRYLELELEMTGLADDMDFSSLCLQKLDFGTQVLQCYAKESVAEFLQQQVLLRPVKLPKIAPLQINYILRIMRQNYRFKSDEYLYLPNTRQMYFAVSTVINGRKEIFYISRLFVHNLYKEYYSDAEFAARYDLGPVLLLSELIELWLRDEYQLDIIIEQVKLVYLNKGSYLKIGCFIDERFCGVTLIRSNTSLSSLDNITTVIEGQSQLLSQIPVCFPVNVGTCQLDADALQQLAVGDVVILDGYGEDEHANNLLRLDLGNTGFIAQLDKQNLILRGCG